MTLSVMKFCDSIYVVTSIRFLINRVIKERMFPDCAHELMSHLFLRLMTLSSCVEFRMFAYCHSEKESASVGESEHEKCVTMFTKSNCGNFKEFRQNIGRDEGALVPTVKGILPPPVHQVQPRSL